MPNCRQFFFGTRLCLRKLESSTLEEPLFQARHKQTSINHDGKYRAIRAGKTEISVDGGQLLSAGEGGTRVRRVGVLGGGQLARMMIYAAHRLNMSVAVLDPDPTAPGGITADRHVVGHFRDASAIHQLSQLSDVVTVEIEHVNAQGLRDIQRRGVAVNPSPSTLLLIQDKYRQKKAMADAGVPVGDFEETKSREAILAAGERLGYPLVLKAKRFAYDGRGNFVLQSSSEVDEAIEALTKDDDPDGEYGLYAEKYVPFSKELAVLVARNLQGEMVAYEPVQTIQRDSICHLVIAPAPVPKAVLSKAIEVGKSVVGCLEGAGLFAIELFLLPDNKTILFNEVAPRPHNSGHYSIEACSTSQFEQHLRAIAGLPLGDTSMKVGSAVMLNVVGDQDPMTSLNLVNAAMTAPRATIHWYGKAEQRPGRKMGHVTVTGATLAECADSLSRMGVNLTEYSAVDMAPPEPEDKDRPAQVGVIMGSDSDLPTMRAAAEVLEQFNVPYELTIVSAHRTPHRMMEYATTAAKRGIKVIIAGAGGAAHLPGMVASMTPLPVIGVPVRTTGALDGQDALYSIVQMPKGVPVATVAIDNAMNAGLLAVRILGAADPKLSSRMSQYQTDMTNQVLGKVHTLQEVGWKGYGQHTKS